MRIPLTSPIYPNVRHAEVVEAAGCNPVLIQCESGVSLHFTKVQPDRRAGTALKTDCSPGANRGSTSGFRHYFRKLPLDPRVETVFKTTHLPIFQNARVAQLYRVLRFERSGCRLESCREHHFPDVAQCRGVRLRSGKVWVQRVARQRLSIYRGAHLAQPPERQLLPSGPTLNDE